MRSEYFTTIERKTGARYTKIDVSKISHLSNSDLYDVYINGGE